MNIRCQEVVCSQNQLKTEIAKDLKRDNNSIGAFESDG